MALNTLDDLFYETLRDMYWAEKHLLKALPKMARKADNPKLAEAFEQHRDETEVHVERLEEIFSMLDRPARGKKCEAIVGLSGEADELFEEGEKGTVRDAGIIGAAQAVEHYEIARYGTLAAWAEVLGLTAAKRLLGETLEEEIAADELLTNLSDAVNEAAEADEEDGEDRRAA